MQPRFKLEIAGQDVTEMISDRVLAISLKDEAGQKSDTLDITLDDRDNVLPIPSARSRMKIWLGYVETELTYRGEFTIDEVSISSGPEQMKVRGKAAEASSQFKATKTRSWDNQTIGQIVTAIAGEHGLTPSVHADYADKLITHIDQENESDAHFLTRLAKLYGAVSKPADGRLLFIPEGQGISTSGQTLAPVVIEKTELLSLRATIKERGAYSGVITRFRNKATNLEEEVTTTDPWTGLLGDGPTFRDKKLYTSKDMAESAGKAKLKQLQSGNVSIDFAVPGNPAIFAERPVTLQGVRAVLADQWIVKSVSHSFGSGGYTTKVSAGNKVEGS